MPENDINNMKVWAFYLAQKKWNMQAPECFEVFEKNGLFKCIENGYDYLHLMGYKSVVTELEDILKTKKSYNSTATSNDEKLREYGAVTLLQRTAEKYAKLKGVTIEEALKVISASPIYNGIFDYDGTQLWKEGPDYIICLLESDTPGKKSS
jgi:CRISPR/Cas system-associated protein endoribonuclease Cas2